MCNILSTLYKLLISTQKKCKQNGLAVNNFFLVAVFFMAAKNKFLAKFLAKFLFGNKKKIISWQQIYYYYFIYLFLLHQNKICLEQFFFLTLKKMVAAMLKCTLFLQHFFSWPQKKNWRIFFIWSKKKLGQNLFFPDCKNPFFLIHVKNKNATRINICFYIFFVSGRANFFFPKINSQA